MKECVKVCQSDTTCSIHDDRQLFHSFFCYFIYNVAKVTKTYVSFIYKFFILLESQKKRERLVKLVHIF